MLPTRTVAAFFVALMALSLLPGVPTALAATGSDLVVTKVVIDNLVINNVATIHVTLKNQGDAAISGPFTVFVGLNGYSSSDCVQPTTLQDPNAVPPCYIAVADAWNPADERELTPFNWTVSNDGILANGGSINIMTQIENACVSQGSTSCTTNTHVETNRQGNPGPDSVGGNNLKAWPFYVKAPKLFAYPVRDVENRTNAKINEDWRTESVTRPCLDAQVNFVACKATPGISIKSRYRVVNLGNDVDTFRPRLFDGTSNSDFNARGYQVSFSPAFAKVERNASVDFEALVVVPSSAKSGESFNVGGSAPNLTVAWISDTDKLVTSADTTLCPTTPKDYQASGECGPSTILPFVVGVKHGLNVTSLVKDNLTRITAHNVSEMRVSIKNTGNDVDEYKLTFDAAASTMPPGWIVENGGMPDPIRLAPGESGEMSVRIRTPNNDTSTRGYYTAAFQAQSTTLDPTLPVKFNFTVQLEQYYGIVSRADNPLLRVVPGQTGAFTMAVQNTGNGPQNMTLTVQNVPSGWSWAVSQTAFTLEAGRSAMLFLNATPPPGTPAGQQGAIYVNVSSLDPADRQDMRPVGDPMLLRLEVLAGPNAELAAPLTSTFVDAGNVTTFPLHIRNIGNEASNFTITADGDPLWAPTVSPSYLVLSPVNTPNAAWEGDVTVSMRAPQGASVGQTNRVTVTVRPSTDDRNARQVVFEGRISGPDLAVTRVEPNATFPYSGDPLTVTVRLSNVGNRQPDKPVNVALSAIREGSTIPIANTTFAASDLRAGTSRDVTFTWDTTGIEGSLVLTAAVDPDGFVDEIDETNNVVTKAVTLRTLDLRVVAADGLSGHPGEALSYSAAPNVFLVQYRGNQPSEPVRVEIASEHGWVNADESVLNMELPRQALIPVRVDLVVPDLPGTATDKLTVRVVPTLRPDAAVVATTTTTVLDDEKPRIASVEATPANAKLGDNVTIRVAVQDATGVAAVRANIVTPTSDVVSLLLARQTDGTWVATQPWTQAGTYSVMIAATDASPSANVNDTHNVLATFTLTPGSAPTIGLASGQATTVRTGSAIKLAISDPLGIAKANYSVKGVTYDMGRNYTVDTSGFAAGPVEVTVSAENIYHVATTKTFAFTVDNTPPAIRAVRLTPTAPKAGEDTLVHVETDAKVTAVDVLVKKDGQVVQTLAATKVSAGVFEVTYNPQVGDYTLDVTAKDVAGNQKLSEGAAVFSAKASNALPGLGLVGTVLAGALVALVLRRR